MSAFRKALGSDRDFEKATDAFIPLDFRMLRGVEALRYQCERSAELDADLRWHFHPCFRPLDPAVRKGGLRKV